VTYYIYAEQNWLGLRRRGAGAARLKANSEALGENKRKPKKIKENKRKQKKAKYYRQS
jgi:hypothetical protein